jgi:hypothetical protein
MNAQPPAAWGDATASGSATSCGADIPTVHGLAATNATHCTPSCGKPAATKRPNLDRRMRVPAYPSASLAPTRAEQPCASRRPCRRCRRAEGGAAMDGDGWRQGVGGQRPLRPAGLPRGEGRPHGRPSPPSVWTPRASPR